MYKPEKNGTAEKNGAEKNGREKRDASNSFVTRTERRRGIGRRGRSAAASEIPLENGLWLAWPLAGFAGIADFR